MLRLENVSAGYGAVTALRNVDMIVEAGEVVALIGSNGAGKSTTLRTISGLVRPSTGKIEFRGEVDHRLFARTDCRAGYHPRAGGAPCVSSAVGPSEFDRRCLFLSRSRQKKRDARTRIRIVSAAL